MRQRTSLSKDTIHPLRQNMQDTRNPSPSTIEKNPKVVDQSFLNPGILSLEPMHAISHDEDGFTLVTREKIKGLGKR